MSYIEKKLAKVGINQAVLLKVLTIINDRGNLLQAQLASLAGLPESVVRLFKDEFSGYVRISENGIMLTEKGTELLDDLRLQHESQITVESLSALAENWQKLRPQPKRNLDQFYANAQTTAKRALTMLQKGDLAGRRILFIGDDDLVSVACAFSKQASEITVVDIDPDILSTINKIKQTNGFQIRTIRYDAKNALPKELYHRYDTCFFDPPYTPTGLRLFLSRAIEAVKKEARIYLCYGYSQRSKERGFSGQEVIHRSGLLIEEKIPDFNQYQKGAESIGNRSSLYICSTTHQTKPLTNEPFKGPIYTGKKF